MIRAAERATAPLRGGTRLKGLGLSACLALAGCVAPPIPDSAPQESLRPVPRAQAEATDPAPPSARSRLLSRRYDREETEDLARGLLREDGNAPDAPYDAARLAATFERLAFFGEYRRGAGLAPDGETPDVLLRWQDPVRISLQFGSLSDAARQSRDRTFVEAYARRLARLTSHAVTLAPTATTTTTTTATGRTTANFHVLVMGEDDHEALLSEMRRLVPDISSGTLNTLRTLPPEVPCLVMGFSSARDPAVYDTAIAVVRAELPDRTRHACFHEEIAQGLGLRNDSPEARPSIFNDDGEFALLTTMDEKMLAMLYDPRLRPGMTLEEARPVIATLAGEEMARGAGG